MAFFDVVLEPGLTDCPGLEVRSQTGVLGKEVTTAFVDGS
jgi:hypothetical protein